MKSRTRKSVIGRLLVLLLVAWLSGCAAPAPPADSAAGGAPPSGAAAGSDPTAAQPAGPAGPGAPKADAPVLRWVPIGPVGPSDPTAGQRYLLLQQRQCDALEQSLQGADDAEPWKAAAAVCRALQSGAQRDWDTAGAAVAAAPSVTDASCLERTVATVSAAVVAYHRAHPGLALTPEPGTGEACPRHLSGLTVVDAGLKPVPGLSRPSGPSSGGTVVRLDGYYVRVDEVKVDGETAFLERPSGGGDYETLYLTMPPAEGKESIRITITDTLEVRGSATFFYDDTTPTTKPPETTGTAGPAGTPPDGPGETGTSSGTAGPTETATDTATP
ncbi:hypothetical protein [Arthrobacter sp. CJ23]|uniref:hypothetical protein n=1 Tax=Arthrobacter sp. CJ23 TaxID=2972479 RepID=UPI00215C103C|nr:hypothetical protein [Arthrobacter sp. CJ23]UVJ41464.1 hypothetical protein NVV90_10110 [Arthrobacter sp. CJ23]